MFIGEVARKIIEDINNNPHNWDVRDIYTITNGPEKVVIWIKSGAIGVGIWDGNNIIKIFNYFERWAIYKCYKNLIRQREKAHKNRLSKKILENLSK